MVDQLSQKTSDQGRREGQAMPVQCRLVGVSRIDRLPVWRLLAIWIILERSLNLP